MNDCLRLLSHLDSLREKVIWGPERKIALQDPKNMALQLFRLIDETVLPRILTVRNTSGSSFDLEVASRRVLRISAYSGKDASGLVGPLYQNSENAVSAGFFEFLEDFFTEGDDVFVASISNPNTASKEPSNAGCSAQALAEKLGQQLYQAKPTIGLGNLLGLVSEFKEDDCVWLCLEGERVVEYHGTDQQLAQFSELGPHSFDALDKKLVFAPGHSDPIGCVLFSESTDKANTRVFIRVLENRAFLMVPNTRVSQFFKTWKHLLWGTVDAVVL